MSLLKDVILQYFFALTPFVIFHIYYGDKLRNYSRSFILLTSSICMFFAMTFASSVVDGVFFDIRYVLVFFALVYSGIQAALVLIVEVVLYRLYLGGEGTWAAMVIVACSFLPSLWLARLLKKTHRKLPVIFLTGITLSVVALGFTTLFFPGYVLSNLVYHLFVIPMQNAVGILLLMYLFNKSVTDKEVFIRHAQKEKRETMSHVAASLAHEVRNPLTAVKGFLWLIQQDPLNLAKNEQYIQISLDEIQRTESILSEYLSISKPLTERLQLTDFSEQLQISKDVMSPFANMHNVEMDMYTQNTPIMIMANPSEIKQVLVNFIKNAIEACSSTPNGKVTLKLVTENQQALLIIKDNGIGMNEEQISRLGSIYFSAKSNGTGLGLTYSYQVIQALGGTINVFSKPGVGTMFHISFPYQIEKKAKNHL